MIVVSLFCVTFGGYVGWQKRIVSDRQAYLQTIQDTHLGPYAWGIVPFTRGDKSKAPSDVRPWLGDLPCDYVIVDRQPRTSGNAS